MGLGDILSSIGTGVGRGLKATGVALGDTLPQVGLMLTGQQEGLDREARARNYQLDENRRQVLGEALKGALQTETDPDKRTAIAQQLEGLYSAPQPANPPLLQRLHSIIHPNGAVAQSPSAPPVPDAIARTIGQSRPLVKTQQGTFDIPGDQLVGQHDIFGNPVDPKKVYRGQQDVYGRMVGLVPSQPRTSGVPRVLPPISMSSAKRMAEMGISFNDETGEPIDVTQFDDTMQMVPVKMGNVTTYVPTSQGQTHFPVGGMVFAIPKLEQTNLATKGTPLGPSKVNTVTTHESVAVDPTTGQAVKQTLTNKSVPIITGAIGPTPEQSQPQQSAQPQAAQPAQPAQQRPIVPRAPVQPQAATPGAPARAPLAFMTPGMYNQQLQVARPLRTAGNQIFGDPTQPNFKSLADYGDVLRNPASVQRIGAAAKIMINELASEDPTKSGGFWTTLTTSMGLPQALAAAQARATSDALNQLTPREHEFFNAALDAYGTIIGLRAITKGSAAKFSAQSLEREVPLPGFAIPANNASQFSFYDKLSRLAEEVYSGSKGNAVLSPQEKAYYQQQYDRLQALKEQARPRRKVGDPVRIGGQTKRITAIHPDGTFDAE